MKNPKAYDKAKWHAEAVEQHGLPASHASHHIVFFFRWLIEQRLVSEWLKTDFSAECEGVIANRVCALDFFQNLDGCLVSDMLSDEGNLFADEYFDYERGFYLKDLIETLKGELPSEYHIPFNDETYSRLKPVLDQRFANWKSRAGNGAPIKLQSERKWWRFWE